MELQLRRKRILDKLTVFALLAGIICFGFVFADSTSDHNKIVHFSAHFGMSFLISSVVYAFCNIKLGINTNRSFILLTVSTFIIGFIYKCLEILSLESLSAQSPQDLNKLLETTGFFTSMSQNIAGIMAAILIIKYFFSRQIVFLPVTKQNLALLNDLKPSVNADIVQRKTALHNTYSKQH